MASEGVVETVLSEPADPTFRIGSLPPANKALTTVGQDDPLNKAVTMMLQFDYSQLPIMHGEREVKGMISWKSIASRYAIGGESCKVQHCREDAQVVEGNGDGKAAHWHPEGQLSAVADGLLIISVEGASLMLPPRRVGWIPPETVHAGASYGTRMGWIAYLHRSLCARLPKRPTILKLTPLSEALFARICDVGMDASSNSAPASKLMDVLLNELRSAESEELQLPIPADPRLAGLAAALIQDPSDSRSLYDCARSIGFSERSLSRHFRKETNMSFVEWRTMARMKRAIEQMTEGSSVTDTAIAVGYDSVSSFIVQFRQTFGTTPANYRRGRRSGLNIV